MWPDRVSNPGPLTYKSCVLPTDCATWPGMFGLEEMNNHLYERDIHRVCLYRTAVSYVYNLYFWFDGEI